MGLSKLYKPIDVSRERGKGQEDFGEDVSLWHVTGTL